MATSKTKGKGKGKGPAVLNEADILQGVTARALAAACKNGIIKPGIYHFDHVVELHVHGTAERLEDTTAIPTASIPWQTVFAYLLAELKISDQEEALTAVRTAVRKAMRTKEKDVSKAIKALNDDIANAAEKIRKDITSRLAKVPKKGAFRTASVECNVISMRPASKK